MTAAANIEKFVQRQRRERIAAGRPETITDPDVLALVAAFVTNQTRNNEQTPVTN